MGSFCTGCRLILDFVIGPRKQYVADKFVELANTHLSDKIPVFVTDGLKFYGEALLKQFGVLEEFSELEKEEDQRNQKSFPLMI